MKAHFAIPPHELENFQKGKQVSIASMDNCWAFFVVINLDDVVVQQGTGSPTIQLKLHLRQS